MEKRSMWLCGALLQPVDVEKALCKQPFAVNFQESVEVS